MRLWIVGIFVLGIAVGYNYGALRNIWDWETGSLEKLNRDIAFDKSDRLALIIMTEKNQYVLSRIDPKYELKLVVREKVNP